jgi:hypothetical protein
MVTVGLLHVHIKTLTRREDTLALALGKEKLRVTRPSRGLALSKPMGRFSRSIGINIMLHNMMSDRQYPVKQEEGTKAFAAVRGYIVKLQKVVLAFIAQSFHLLVQRLKRNSSTTILYTRAHSHRAN